MKEQDMRFLSPSAQDALRERVIQPVHQGMSQAEAARVFGVSRQSVNKWYGWWRKKGIGGLSSRPRGRPSSIRLWPWQAAAVVRLITDRCPDQWKLPFVLWTREAVRDLIGQRFGIMLSVWTVGRYLKKWGFTPQKPLLRAYERNPQAVRSWLTKEYPAIKRRAKIEGATIFWGDAMGMRSDHLGTSRFRQAGTSYGRKGETPVILATGQRFQDSMISAITNRGKLAFMVFGQKLKAWVFIGFMNRLVRHNRGRKVFFIVDEHPVHVSGKVEKWVEEHKEHIRLFFLPGYSPDLNLDELLNQDVKTNAVGRKRPHNRVEMLRNERSYL